MSSFTSPFSKATTFRLLDTDIFQLHRSPTCILAFLFLQTAIYRVKRFQIFTEESPRPAPKTASRFLTGIRSVQTPHLGVFQNFGELLEVLGPKEVGDVHHCSGAEQSQGLWLHLQHDHPRRNRRCEDDQAINTSGLENMP